MVGPSVEKLATMGLLEKKESMSTEVVYLREDEKRQTYFDQFKDHNEGVEGLAGVQWGRDSTPTSNGLRCNASVVLMSVGAKIPELGARQAKDIPPSLQYPMTALAEWGEEYLTAAHTQYKRSDRVLISEPSKMKVDHYFDYLPKKIHDTRMAVVTKFVAENSDGNPGLAKQFVTIKYILMRCNRALDHRGDVEEHTLQTHGININDIEIEATIQVNDGETLVLSAALNIRELPVER